MQSFEDLRTVASIQYATFQAACVALGLLEDDQEWSSCFTKVVVFSSGIALQTLFAMALLYGGITDPSALWTRFCEHICNDLAHRLRSHEDILVDLQYPHLNYRLYLINQILADFGKSLIDFSLPVPAHNWSCTEGNPLIVAELCYDIMAEATLEVERFA